MASEALIVTIPGTPTRAMSPNGRAFWATRNRDVQQLRGDAKSATQEVIGRVYTPPFPDMPATSMPLTLHYVVAWERGRKRMDDDNLKAALKAAQDGIADALGVNDKHMIVGTVTQTRDQDKRGYIKVAIEPAAKEQAA